jgi:hypothetical protein
MGLSCVVSTSFALAPIRKRNVQMEEKSMKRRLFATIPLIDCALIFGLLAARPANAQDTKTPYPNMAPVEQYMMERDAEIALARSAAPESISKDAEVMVMGRHGYEIAAKGTNGFVCIVERGWTAPIDDPDFWNPKLRGPICLNPAAARTYLPLTLKKTESILAGRSKAQMFEDIRIGFEKKELPALEPGAMSYMLSKEQYLGDRGKHWHPHVMFFVPETETALWGANLDNSPVLGFADKADRLTIFLIPVGEWSDGTPGPDGKH